MVVLHQCYGSRLYKESISTYTEEIRGIGIEVIRLSIKVSIGVSGITLGILIISYKRNTPPTIQIWKVYPPLVCLWVSLRYDFMRMVLLMQLHMYWYISCDYYCLGTKTKATSFIIPR